MVLMLCGAGGIIEYPDARICGPGAGVEDACPACPECPPGCRYVGPTDCWDLGEGMYPPRALWIDCKVCDLCCRCDPCPGGCEKVPFRDIACLQ